MRLDTMTTVMMSGLLAAACGAEVGPYEGEQEDWGPLGRSEQHIEGGEATPGCA